MAKCFNILAHLFGVYKITNKTNGKFYIGSTKESFFTRWNHHVYTLKKNKHYSNILQRAWNKYGGDCFSFDIIAICNEESEVRSMEQRSINESLPDYNIIMDVGKFHDRHGSKHSDQTRQLMRQSHAIRNRHYKREEAKIVYNGIEMPISFWAKKYNIHVGTIRSRMRAGCGIHDALNREVIPLLCINGCSKSIKEWSSESGTSIRTIQRRLHKNYTPEEAVFKPMINSK